MKTKRDFEKNPIVVTLTVQVYVYEDLSDQDLKDALPVDDLDFQEDLFGIMTNGLNNAGLNEVKLEIKR